MPMSRGVPVELDRERRLRYPMAAIEAIEQKYDVDVLAGDGLPHTSLEDIVWIVWLGLHHAGETLEYASWWKRLLSRLNLIEDRELEPSDVAEWIDMQNLPRVTDALEAAMGGAELEEQAPEGKPRTGPEAVSASSGLSA